MFPATKPQQRVSAASLTSNVDAEAVNTTRFVVQNQDGDRNQPLAVCRVCLARSVKMYHMSEHNLSVMYERVTRVEVHTEDKLPKMLCWECVARLSSANNFLENALKTQWILLNKIVGEKITMSDIESIDRAQYQLESTLGVKYYEVNNTDLHILRESDIAIDHSNVTNIELISNNYENSEVIGEEEFTIKNEILEIIEQVEEEEEDFQVPRPIFIMNEHLSDEEMMTDSVSNVTELYDYENHIVDEERGVSKAIKSNPKGQHCSVTPHSDRNDGLCFAKEPRLIIEDVMLGCKTQNTQDSFKGLSTKYKENVTHPPLKKQIYKLKDGNTNDMDVDNRDTSKAEKVVQPGLGNLHCSVPKNTTKMGSVTGAGNSKINVNHHDAEPSKQLFICDICDRSFWSKISLLRHIQRHLNLFKCTYCGHKTNDKSCLKRHVNSKHTKVFFFKCTYCDYKAYDKSNLQKHVNRKHTKNIVYSCSYCSHKTYDQRHLKNHVNSNHTKKTIHKCSHCSYQAYYKSSINRHIKAKHT